MNILVICQYYSPEPFRISDTCEELVKRGHSVTVVTGVPNYPEGEIYPGYENAACTDTQMHGVKVHRCPLIPRKTGALYRFLNYYSFVFSSKKYVRTLKEKYDVVFVNQLSPVMMAQAAITYKKKTGTPIVMYCLDLWPESLVAGGIQKGSLIYKLFHRISKRIYQRMDKILITSRSFGAYFEEEFGITDTEYLPQYAEELFCDIPKKEQTDTIDLMFAGNIGELQSVDTVIEAAALLKDDCPQLRFHIVGSGTDLDRIQTLAQSNGIDNVIFYGRRPLEEMPDLYAKADAMLVTMKDDPVLSMTLPGKVQSYMAAGKPIIGAIGGETARVIEEARCGFCAPPENPAALAECIKRFAACDSKDLMATASTQYYTTMFTSESYINGVEKCLHSFENYE